MYEHPTHVVVYPTSAAAAKAKHRDRPTLTADGVSWPNDGYTASAIAKHGYATTDPSKAFRE